MSNGYHAADDGSLARSTGGAAARGAMLIALALVIGLILMAFALDDPQTVVAGSDADATDVEVTDEVDESAVGDETDTEDAVNVGEPTPDDGTTTDTIAAVTDSTPDTIAEAVPPGEARPASEVNVLVANGIGGQGVAGSIADKLTADGYLANASNAPSTEAAVIFYREGFAADARAVATALSAPPDIVVPVPDGTIAVDPAPIADGRLDAANVIVIIGADNNIPVG